MPNKTTTQPPVSDAEALKIVSELMAIPGSSGQEAAVMAYLTAKLAEEGAPPVKFDQAHKRSQLGGEVGNATLQLKGNTRSPRRLLAAHTDTVPICVGSQPKKFGKEIGSADPATGVGADNRSGVAVLLTTVLGLLRSGAAHGPLTFLWTVQEEADLHGARHVPIGSLGKPKLAFNFDGGPSSILTVGATGGYRIKIVVHGKGSHAGGAPEKGVSAIAIASLAIADLVENGWHGLIEKGKNRGTSNVGVIQGGAATNVLTDWVLLQAEARSHDPAFRKRIVREMKNAFVKAAKRVKSVEGLRGAIDFSENLQYESFHLPADDPSIAAAREAVLACGKNPEIAIGNGCYDANWLSERGVPMVTLGCGQKHIHSAAERLDIADFHLARRIAWRLATGA